MTDGGDVSYAAAVLREVSTDMIAEETPFKFVFDAPFNVTTLMWRSKHDILH